jgi:hypothetical protein
MMKTLAILVCLAGIPADVLAQAAIVGTVSDARGAPLPGVAVEATSDALLEHARTTLTDGAGRFRVEDLPPGTYQVRFRLDGWKTHHVDGVQATASLAATVNARLAAGELAETVTAIAEPPVIDVHDARRAVTLTGGDHRLLPTARTYNALLGLLPGLVTNVTDTIAGPSTTAFPLHGGRQNEGRLMLDGLTIGSPPSGNSATSYDVDVARAQEVTLTMSGGLGEPETAGLVMNIVPKAGGNTTHGSIFASGSDKRLQSSNLTSSLIDQGVIAAAPFTKLYDISATLGGPIAADRVWYFLTAHKGSSTRNSTNVYYNVNAGDADEWRYVPDLIRPSYSDRTFENLSGRMTWQIAERHKLSGFWDAQALCRSCTGATPGVSEPPRISPEAVGVLGRRLDVTQATWSSPITNRLLLEAGYGGTSFGVGNFEREPNPTRNLVRVVEQCASGCAANGNIPGLTYRSQDFSVAHTGSFSWKGSASYITGTHTLKIGYQQTLMTDDRTWMTNNQALTYRVDNGVPTQLTQSISPWVNDARAGWQAIFVQEQWTRRQLTLQAALRFDRARSWFPAQREGPSRFLPAPIVIAETRGVDSYKDISPRFGIAYDPGGTGKTAIKASVGRYLEGAGVAGIYANTNPTLRMPQTTPAFGTPGVTRAWTDANGNFTPDCDLLNPGAQDLRASGGDLCGVLSNVSFGKHVLTNMFDANILRGWGVRPSDWNVAVSFQRQIGRRASLDVTYNRRSFEGETVADNLSLQPSDLTPFNLAAPLDPRLPGGGGYIVRGLYDVIPEKAGQVNNLVTDSTAFGRWYQYYNGVDVTLDARLNGSMTLTAATSTGQIVADNCDVRAHLPELATTTMGTTPFGGGLAASAVTPVSPYCHVAFGVLTQLRLFSSYLVPRIDVQVGARFSSRPGPPLAANYAAPNAAVAPSLGRNLSANASSVTVNLITPGSLYGARINQLDLRLAKMLKHGRSRMVLGVDLYNVLNGNVVVTYNNTFVPGGPWLQPLAVLTPRLLKVTAELDW